MSVRKRGFHKNRDDFFRSKLVLDSWKSKVTFFVIVLMFGVVISIWVWDVYGGLIDGGVGGVGLRLG